MSSSAGELAAINDQIFVANRPALEPTLKDLASARRITSLSG
jgi:hypothetical protein